MLYISYIPTYRKVCGWAGDTGDAAARHSCVCNSLYGVDDNGYIYICGRFQCLITQKRHRSVLLMFYFRDFDYLSSFVTEHRYTYRSVNVQTNGIYLITREDDTVWKTQQKGKTTVTGDCFRVFYAFVCVVLWFGTSQCFHCNYIACVYS